MKEDNIFQYILLGLFALFAVGGVIAFALFRSDSASAVPITVWGEVPKPVFDALTNNEEWKEYWNFTYTYVRPEVFDETLVDALSSGRGPDVAFMSSKRLLTHQSRIIPLSNTEYSPIDFKERFLDSAETLYLSNRGTEGLPAFVDPLIVFWNPILVKNAGYLEPPQTWDEYPEFVERVRKLDAQGQIDVAALPFGGYENVGYGREVLSTLLLQAGTSITTRSAHGELQSSLTAGNNSNLNPAHFVVDFFTEFSNSQKQLYTWNESLANSGEMFAAGRLAMYPAPVSAFEQVVRLNPNTLIEVSEFPQVSGSAARITHADFFGFSVVRSEKIVTNPRFRTSAKQALLTLTSPEAVARADLATNLAAAVRSVLSSSPGDSSIKRTANRSAVIARSWLGPSHNTTDEIFRKMIESVTTGRLRVAESVREANNALGRSI